MKQRILKLLSACTVIFLIAFSGNPPDGRTDAPGDGYCTDCHSAGAQSGSVTIDGVPTDIVPGQTYTISVISTTTSNSVRAGFQMVALHDDGNINAGTMSNPSTSSTVTNAGARTYHEHQPAQGFGGGDMVSWTVDWTAPMTGPNGDITFYAASVLANGGNGNQGDGVVKTNVSGAYMAAANPPSVTVTVNSGTTCNGFSDGSATANPTDGTPPYFYAWPSGETSQTATMLAGGMGVVTVTDNVGETATATYTISEPAALDANLSVQSDISCAGAEDGSLISNPTGGTSPYNYAWSNGGNTMDIDQLGPNTYTITVTDANGCEVVDNIELTSPTPVVVTIQSNIPPSCVGADNGSASADATGGNPPYTYTWSNGETGPVATNLLAGTYTVTATDITGCTGTIDVTITDPDAIVVIVANVTNVTCAGGDDGSITLAVSGGTAPYEYLWSNGGNSNTIANVPAGNYSCTITDANDCATQIGPIDVQDGYSFTVDLTITNETADNANDGTIAASPSGGQSPYEYLWSNGSTDPAIVSLPPATYTVTVTDVNGCEQVATGEVLPAGCDLTVDIVLVDAISCPDEIDGSLSIDPSGAVSSILWSTGDTTETITDLAAGQYSVTVTDDNQCLAVDNYNLLDDDMTGPMLVQNSLCVVCDSFQPVELNAIDFLALWEDECSTVNSVSPATFVVPCDNADPISLTVSSTDQNGNTSTDTLSITIRESLSINALATAIACDEMYSQVNYVITGGADSFDVSLSPMADVDSLLPGEYIAFYSDGEGCSVSDTFTVADAPASLTIDTTYVVDALADMATGSIEVVVSSDSPIADVIWTDSLGNEVDRGDVIADSLYLGSYNVIVINEDGCTDTLLDIQVGIMLSASNPQLDQGFTVYAWNDILTINTRITDPYSAELYNAQGQVVKRINKLAGDQQIVCNTLANGMYIVRLTLADGRFTSKKVILGD